MESEEHRTKVKEAVEALRQDGYHAIILDRKSPDAIAVKDGKILAVEILPKVKDKRKGFGWKYQSGVTIAEKKRYYSMFDDVLVFPYYKK